MGSPFGKYAQIVAAVAALAILGADGFVHVTGGAADPFLDNLAFAAFGAIFGASASTAATNGSVGRQLAALQTRLDNHGVPAAAAAPTAPEV